MTRGDDAAAPSTAEKHGLDRSEMKRVFDLFDQNKDGHISEEELQLYMRRLGFELSDQKVRNMVGTVDKNRDEVVDFEEFLSLYNTLQEEGAESWTPRTRTAKEAKKETEQEEALLKAFSVFDGNKDGLISAVELQQVLLRLGLPEGKSLLGCQRMIERVDADGNGKVDFVEFKKMMSNSLGFSAS